jgi:hypothetical protein
VRSAGNFVVCRELWCLLGTVMSTGNCDVCRELCLQVPGVATGTGMSTGRNCRCGSNLQRKVCLECYCSLREK